MMNAIQALESKHPSEVGQFYAFLGTVFFFLLQAFAKLFKERIHFSQLAFVRALCFFLMLYGISLRQGIPVYPKARLGLMSIRNLMGFQVSIGLFYGVTKIPMSQNVMLLQLAQVAIPLVDRFLYRTKYSLIELSISVIAVFGVYLVLNGKEQQDDDGDYVQGWEKVFVVFILFLSITLGFSFSNVLTKEFKNDNLVMINVNFGVVGMIASTICQISYEKYQISLSDFILVFFLMGSAGCLSQTCILKAYTLTKPGKAALFNCLNVIYAFLVEVTILDEYPTLTQLLGAMISICCIIYSINLRE